MSKTVAWCVPLPSRGAGGFRTILQNARALELAGYESDFYVISGDMRGVNQDSVRRDMAEWYGYSSARNIYICPMSLEMDYDLAIATQWDTAPFVAVQQCKNKAYFIQDYEPFFYPMSSRYLAAEATYRLGLTPITIGRWLVNKCRNSDETTAYHTDFGANLSVYHPIDQKREHAVCAIYQPDKPRRASRLLFESISVMQELDPSLTIYLFGSNADFPRKDPRVINLGLLSIDELNNLYNRCACGVSFSSSNPSRIPFEMMAAGLPVVELYGEQTIFDLPQGPCVLAQPDAASIATATMNFVRNKNIREAASLAGVRFMTNRSLDNEGRQFADACENITDSARKTAESMPPLYLGNPCEASLESTAAYTQLVLNEQTLRHESVTPLYLQGNALTIALANDALDLKSAVAAVWSKDDQSDIQWTNLEKKDDWMEGRVPVPDDFEQFTLAHIHLYGTNDLAIEPQYIVGIDKPLSKLNQSEDTEIPTHCEVPFSKGSVSLSTCTIPSSEQTTTTSANKTLAGRVKSFARRIIH